MILKSLFTQLRKWRIDLGTMEYKPLTSHDNIKYQLDFSDIVKNTDFNLEEIKEVYAEFEAGYRVDIDGTDRQQK